LAANHVWQSTGFAALAVLLALALRANHARARYWLWLAASVKFLVPFSVLAAIGSSLGRWFVPATPISLLPFVMEQIVQPFAPVQDAVLPSVASAPATTNLLPVLLLAFWFCGFFAVLLYGWARWRRVAATVHSSAPLTEGRELESLRRLQWGGPEVPAPFAGHLPSLVSSTAKLEPGVFGIFRPVLWLPAGIGDRLDDAELEAILAHELSHIRRRDNLLATIHMAVEAIFWFHPVVWWLGARLEEERERACDEEVVRMGGEPQIYAESILKVCEFYLASPVACAAGVTGGELKKRIEGIMTNRFTRELSFGKKMLLAAAALVALTGPIVIGLTNPTRSRAQAQAAPPAFDVASVVVSTGREVNGFYTYPGGRVSCHGCDMRYLLQKAFNVEGYQLSGAPLRNDSGRYDIEAKPPAASKASQAMPPYPKAPPNEEQRQMLQSLLVERFQLRYHRDEQEGPIYLLIRRSGALHMEDSKDKTAYPWSGGLGGGMIMGDGMSGQNESMPDLAWRLSSYLEKPVIDQTGLTGSYDFRVEYSADEQNPDVVSMILTTVQQLGLKLEPSRGPVETIVVERLEKPSAN
jgi:uncharacterized protein (TIGR03435 family)